MKEQSNKAKGSGLVSLRVIIGAIIAIAGFAVFVLSAMMGIIEPTTTNILIGFGLMIGGLLIANSVKVAQFLHDIS